MNTTDLTAKQQNNTLPYHGRQSGVHVQRLQFDAGAFDSKPSPYHALCMHLGDPVAATCSLDGMRQQRMQSQGDIDIVPASYWGKWCDQAPASILQVQLEPRLLLQAARELSGHPASFTQLRPGLQVRDARLESMMLALAAEADAGYDNGRLFTDSLCSALALHLVRKLGSDVEAGAGSGARKSGFSARQQRLLVEYIEQHLDQDLSLAQLQSLVDVGATQFKLLFKRSFSSTVHEYVMRRRVDKARRLIIQRDLSLAEIAWDTGFADQSHMARCMRRVLGLRPSDLRRL